ncbi:hypothetical protein GGR52DRAFT_567882 [Hypoxylon sp. FL1284]|nr:hypothetical protein GGR52DRAFT_567882 [Hypoxylon sp. FL1284]
MSKSITTLTEYWELRDEFKRLGYLDDEGNEGNSKRSPTPSDTTCDLDAVRNNSPDHKPRDYPKSAFQAGAHAFCYRDHAYTAMPNGNGAKNWFWFDTTHNDPNTELPAECYGAEWQSLDQPPPDSQKYCKGGQSRYNSDSKVWFIVEPSPDQSGCKPIKDYKLPTGRECEKRFDNVINQCMKDGHGTSGIWKEETDNGCWDWSMWGQILE